MDSSPGIFTEVVYLYLARHLTPVALGHEQEEVIEVHWLPLNQALEWCRDGTISDAKTLIGLSAPRPCWLRTPNIVIQVGINAGIA